MCALGAAIDLHRDIRHAVPSRYRAMEAPSSLPARAAQPLQPGLLVCRPVQVDLYSYVKGPRRRLIRQRPHNCSAGSMSWAWPLPAIAPSFPTLQTVISSNMRRRGEPDEGSNNNNNNKMACNCPPRTHRAVGLALTTAPRPGLQSPPTAHTHTHTRTLARISRFADRRPRSRPRPKHAGASTYSPP